MRQREQQQRREQSKMQLHSDKQAKLTTIKQLEQRSNAVRRTVQMLALLICALALASACVGSAQSSPTSHDSHSSSEFSSAGYNNLDNLISDFLDDAGNRLKKSRLNPMRQIKPTLRFGRRSDPMMAPTFADQAAELERQSQYETYQRRLLAAALAASAARAK